MGCFLHGRLIAQETYCTGGLLHGPGGLLHEGLIARMLFDRGLLTGGILHGMLFDRNLFVGGLLTPGAFYGGANSQRLIPGGNCRRSSKAQIVRKKRNFFNLLFYFKIYLVTL
jgi:hypothetical protein